MPNIDFGNISEAEEFTPVPPGRYLCELIKIEEKSTDNGNEMWNLKFEIKQGDQKGRYIFDRLIFSTAAMPRVKLICSRFGLDVSGEINLDPGMIAGKFIYVTAEKDSYYKDGKQIPTTKVPFAGYEHFGGGEETAMAAGAGEDSKEGDLPF